MINVYSGLTIYLFTKILDLDLDFGIVYSQSLKFNLKLQRIYIIKIKKFNKNNIKNNVIVMEIKKIERQKIVGSCCGNLIDVK